MQDDREELRGVDMLELPSNATDRDILVNIHARIKEMHPIITTEVPRMQLLLERITTAQDNMSAAATRMAETNERAELRFSKLEDRLQSANDKASGKGQIPLISHYLILGSMVLIAILVVLYVNKQTIDATLTSIKVGQEKTEKVIKQELNEHR